MFYFLLLTILGIIEILLGIFLPDRFIAELYHNTIKSKNIDKYVLIQRTLWTTVGIIFIALGIISRLNLISNNLISIFFILSLIIATLISITAKHKFSK